jgi:L-ribulose-5-phosphate 3-epimerase
MASKLGVTGLELAAAGELAPAQLTQSGRREIRHLFASSQLSIAAVAAPLRFGLDIPEQQDARIDFIRQAMSLAADLGCPRVVIQPGPIPSDEKDPRYPLMFDALLDLGRHGDRIGVIVALEPAGDEPHVVEAFLAQFDTGGLALAYNPGFLLIQGRDPYQAVRQWRSRIVYAHATDARRGAAPRLVPVGRGDLDWMELLAAFAEVEYRGFLTADFEPGVNAEREAAESIGFLQRLVR